MRAEEVGLNAEQVPVSTGVVEQCLDAGLLLNQNGQRQRADTRAGPQAVGDVDDVDAPDLQLPRSFDDFVCTIAAWRNQLDRGNKCAPGQRVREARFLLPCDGRRQDRRCGNLRSAERARRDDGRPFDPAQGRRHAPNRDLDLPDVFRSGAAAAADDPDTVLHEPARVRRHVVGRTEIDIAALDIARLAGVGLRG